MKAEITDEEADLLEDYYFGKYAVHNDDWGGCELWMSDLDREEVDYIINKIKNEITSRTS